MLNAGDQPGLIEHHVHEGAILRQLRQDALDGHQSLDPAQALHRDQHLGHAAASNLAHHRVATYRKGGFQRRPSPLGSIRRFAHQPTLAWLAHPCEPNPGVPRVSVPIA